MMMWWVSGVRGSGGTENLLWKELLQADILHVQIETIGVIGEHVHVGSHGKYGSGLADFSCSDDARYFMIQIGS